MRHLAPIAFATLALSACGGREPAPRPAVPTVPTEETGGGSEPSGEARAESGSTDISDFVASESGTAKEGQGATASKIKPTRTEAALKFVVTNKDTGPIPGIVIALTDPKGRKYYMDETDANGYTELLVPVGQTYNAVYLSLGRREIAAAVPVSDEPNQNIRLTLRYKRVNAPDPKAPTSRMVLSGITFDTGSSTLRPDSLEQFESIIEFMTHKPSARVQISGHTDNVGNRAANKRLSQARADACRDYLITKGIGGDRIDAVGYGDEQPVAPNNTEDGRRQNRRIEASTL